MEHKKNFSYMWLSLFVLLLVVNLVQIVLGSVFSLISPTIVSSSWFLILCIFFSMHVIGFLVYFLMMKPRQPQPARDKTKISPLRFIKIFIICMGATYLFNFISLGINALISLIKHAPVSNPLASIATGESLILQVLVLSVSAPIVEELIFRKLMLDRLRPYGDMTAIWVSALAFSLFHGNLSQALYAFVLGLIFAYVVIRTNNILYSIGLHILVNLFGSAIMPLIALSGNTVLITIAGLLVYVFLIAGIIAFITEKKHIKLNKGEITLTGFERFKTHYLNIGMALYFIMCAIMFIAAILV